MQKRTLTVNFARAVTADLPNTMEVSVTPLSAPSEVAGNTTLVGGPQTRTVLLAQATNTVAFQLVPTDDPDLTAPVTYRIAWRERYLGRQYTADFAMPDADLTFAQLVADGHVISTV